MEWKTNKQEQVEQVVSMMFDAYYEAQKYHPQLETK